MMPGIFRRMVWMAALVGGVVLSRLDGAEAAKHQLLSFAGEVTISRKDSTTWDAASANMFLAAGDRLRTGPNSRADVRLSTRAILPISENSVITLGGDSDAADVSSFELQVGKAFFLGNDKPGRTRARSRSVAGAVRGTEFHMEVAEDGTTTISLFDGVMDLENAQGKLTLSAGQGAVIEMGKAPELRPLIETSRGVQWYLYYPAIVAREDFGAANDGIEAYAKGDLNAAARFGGEGILRAATLLSVGQITKAEAALQGIDSEAAEAIRRLIAAVTQPTNPPARREWKTASGWLAESYRDQAALDLKRALASAEKAISISPKFGAGWIRAAELEFGFGRVDASKKALERGLEFSPLNAQGWALQGFLFAAESKFADAERSFDHAIALDGALGNAWLGRGLVRMRRGERESGYMDLQTAAALDPRRAVVRSYLAKALTEVNEPRAVEQELNRAMNLDPNDPTAWLYSALIRFNNYQLGEAIHDLEESAARNENRAVYRSRMLLDQDAAVRSANLANIYEMADMADVARRESSRAVMFDYANYSAHLNLASSFNAQRDPTRFNLRNETVWFNEHLLASLLAPTDAAPLSQALSANEYSRLFARNRVGFTTSSEVFSSGEVRQVASQFGNFNNFSYALDLDSAWSNGERPNQDLDRIEFYTRAKFAITPSDSLLLLAKIEDYESGDNFQYSDPSDASATFRFREWQTPLALAGYHHEWHPGSHSLLLGGRLQNKQHFTDRASMIVSGPAVIGTLPFEVDARNDFEIYTAEANHILESENHTTIFGGRIQDGEFEARSVFNDARSGLPGFFGGVSRQIGDGAFARRSLYLYHTWEIISDLRVTGGLAYDDIVAPLHYRRPPFEPGDTHRNQWSPKAALIYTPAPIFTMRAMAAQSLGGVSYDESVTLEPTQLAGFPQAFRTLISESLVGSVEIPRHDVAGIGFDFKLPTRTYVGIEGVGLKSKVDRRNGYFQLLPGRGEASGTDRRLRYEEQSARLIVNQTITDELFAQGLYQFTRADLDQAFVNIPAPATFNRESTSRADMHRFGASLLYQRPDGWFARGRLTYIRQEAQPITSDSVPFGDIFIGWRFPKLKGDITFGVLNIGDQNYQLHPLTTYEEFPRERTFYARFRLNL
jgi:tetratricopeptide (TPR) repeat protein